LEALFSDLEAISMTQKSSTSLGLLFRSFLLFRQHWRLSKVLLQAALAQQDLFKSSSESGLLCILASSKTLESPRF
jgi:hypothetical protein